jgi:hypothetical protein
MTFGAVGRPGDAATVGLTNFTATAWASGAVRDANTAGDMNGHGTRNDGWPFGEPACASSPGSAATGASDRAAAAACDPDRGTASGTARANPYFEIPGALRVTDASAAVSTRLDDALGVVTTASAAVKGVSIANGLIQIDDVEAVAVASARGLPAGSVTGRPDSPGARGDYRRSVGRLVIGGREQCGAATRACGLEQVVEAVNAVPEANVRAVLPHYDAEAAQGTPGGYQAVVGRDSWEQLNDQSMNELSSYDQQTPALRLVIQEDAYQHSALIVDLAAPQAEAHRAVQPCSYCGSSASTGSFGDGGGGSGDGGGGASGFGAPRLPGAGGASGAQALGSAPAGSAASGSGPAASGPAAPAGAGEAPAAIASSFGPPPEAASGPSGSGSGASASGPASSGPLVKAARTVADNAARTASGLKAVATSPKRLAKVALVWAVLALPVYLSSRRRLIRSSQRTV